MKNLDRQVTASDLSLLLKPTSCLLLCLWSNFQHITITNYTKNKGLLHASREVVSLEVSSNVGIQPSVSFMCPAKLGASGSSILTIQTRMVSSRHFWVVGCLQQDSLYSPGVLVSPSYQDDTLSEPVGGWGHGKFIHTLSSNFNFVLTGEQKHVSVGITASPGGHWSALNATFKI